MRYFTFKKLVRDRIPEHMRSQGQSVEGLRRLEEGSEWCAYCLANSE